MDTTARDALARSVCAWVSTLTEDDLRIVDALVMYLVSRTEDQREDTVLRLERPRPLVRVKLPPITDEWPGTHDLGGEG